ncbi:hypothetical protein SDC9_143859 [bioreactor metagenome]|uniref:DUF2971 domain-containing protein n=1 Tax=bioreactor metagenome TaxID=1076179 RepID=A0A645E4J4_9ZZZZ
MDDLQEQQSQDIQNMGKFIFVSSWTDDSIESIPMWKMYTQKHEGVRIKLAVNPFKTYTTTAEEISKELYFPVKEDYINKDIFEKQLIVSSKEIFNDSYTLDNYIIGDQLQKVTYTDDIDILNPKLLNLNDDFNLNLDKLGINKNKYWSFQKEWRYRLMIQPVSSKIIPSTCIKNAFENINRLSTLSKITNALIRNQVIYPQKLDGFQKDIKKGIAALPFDYYDLKISDDAFNTMEIMLAPDISESSEDIINMLVEKYSPNAKIIRSNLDKQIR